MRTPVCDQLGIEFPILAFSHCRDVVAAVSKAGGFGVLGATAYTPEQLDIELAWIEEQVGDKPYGVDVLVPAKYVGVEEGGLDESALPALIPEEHREFVAEILERYGVPIGDSGVRGPSAPGDSGVRGPSAPGDSGVRGPSAPGDIDDEHRSRGRALLNMTHRNAERLLDVTFAHRPRLVANALGPAPDFMVEAAHEREVLVAGLVGKRQHAERQVAAGVDIIVAQGYEAGGHTGEISTMVLVPEVVDAVAPTPVLAAGGIANGRQVAAALALGAQGVWCGSVWLTTDEAETHPVVKEKFLAASSSDTVRSRSTTGKPARQLRSAWTEEWDNPSNPDPLPMPLHGVLIGEAQVRIARTAATNDGARRLVNYFVGQVVGQMNQVRPARQVVLDMVGEYIDAAERMARSLES